MTDTYPWAAEMHREWQALPWLAASYGFPACRDTAELAELLTRQRDALRAIVAPHADPHTRRVFRDTRGDYAEALRLLRLPVTRRRNARIGTICGRLTDALACYTLPKETA